MADFVQVKEVKETEPIAKNVLHQDPLIYTIDDYISREECDHFIDVSKKHLKQAYVSDVKQGQTSAGRTGTNHWVRHSTDDTTTKVGQRIASVVGLPLVHAEAYQVIHYDETQKYDKHYDAYEKADTEKCKRCLKFGGQRLVTALVYLNEVEEGGETEFHNLKIKVSPKIGRLLVFHNCYKGTNDPHVNSLHAGCPVIKGEKYAFNLWFREQAANTLYDFPFLKKESNVFSLVNSQNDSTDTITSASANKPVSVDLNMIQTRNSNVKSDNLKPHVERVSNDSMVTFHHLLSVDQCNYLLSKCKQGRPQLHNRKSYWIQNNETVVRPIISIIAQQVGVDNDYFENMNIIEYPVKSHHGFHFDAFDIESEKGKEYTKDRGQRMYTFVGLLNNNEDINSGMVSLKNYDYNVIHKLGSVFLYKNTEPTSPIHQRNPNLEYSISDVRTHPKVYFYLYLREKNSNGVSLTKEQIESIDEKVKSISGDLNIDNVILQQATESVDLNTQKINYYLDVDNFYKTFANSNRITPHASLTFKRAQISMETELMHKFIDIRKAHSVLTQTNYSSLLDPAVFTKEYGLNENTPAIANNVFLPGVMDLVKEYFKFGIDNQKFSFGDRQAKRFKAYDEFLSRLLQFECLPFIEHITGKTLKPTYTYLSCYVKGTDLPAHTDRPDCEFTVSFMLDKPEGSHWPIYYDKETQPIKYKGRYNETPPKERCIPVDCEPGGLMIFNGTDHIHFREKLEYDFYNIVLLHYVSNT